MFGKSGKIITIIFMKEKLFSNLLEIPSSTFFTKHSVQTKFSGNISKKISREKNKFKIIRI